MLGGRLAPVFFYKGLSAALQLVKRPSDCLSAITWLFKGL